MAELKELPVFFDQTGRRWIYFKLLVLLTLVVISYGVYKIVPLIISPINVPTFSSSDPVFAEARESKSPSEIAYKINRQETPIIGEGPLLRVVKPVKVGGKYWAVDVYSGAVTKELAEAETSIIGAKSYVIERYGQTKGKRIALTFDDGPDPIYTPQILDLLSRESAPSTFFVIGSNVTRFPELAQRMVREGHVIGNHTFTHADFDFQGDFRSEQEITQTQRIIRATINRNPAYFRLPYGGDDDESIRDNMKGILEGQQLGYIVTSYNIDSNDWEFRPGDKIQLPELDGMDKVILLHDGGGDRSQTLTYVEALLSSAKTQGYQFVSLENLYPREQSLFSEVSPLLSDKVTLTLAKSVLVWPHRLITQLFIITIGFLLFGTALNIMLANIQIHLPKSRRKNTYEPFVSIIVPAYNEERVIIKSIRSLLSSDYRNFEIIIVDDGSRDETWRVIRTLTNIPFVYGLQQPQNDGKSAALNRGLKEARGEIIVSIDADTVFTRRTIGNLVRHFYNPKIGAVSGVVKVGNIRNTITRWQSLEYIIGINIERTAQALMRAILIVPGACSAWRKSAISEAGGYSNTTMAEDCDLSLAIRKVGYQIMLDTEAISFTEAPLTLRALAKQRFRWTFGNIQSFWKHRELLFRLRYGWLGVFVLPRAIIGLLVQIIFTPVLLFVTIGNIMAGEINILMFYFFMTSVIQIIITVVGLLFAKERWSHLAVVPVYRIVYNPMRTYLLFSAAFAVLKGAHMSWNKVARTNTVRYGIATVPVTAKIRNAH